MDNLMDCIDNKYRFTNTGRVEYRGLTNILKTLFKPNSVYDILVDNQEGLSIRNLAYLTNNSPISVINNINNGMDKGWIEELVEFGINRDER